MEKTNIQYRSIKQSDYKELEKIIADTWNYEKICTPKAAKIMAKIYLASCLANQTYTCVALNNEHPVGIVMGKNENTHHASLRYNLRQFMAVATMLTIKEGRRVLKTFEGFDSINKALFAESTQKFDGELAFFAVDRNQRGTGVGKELFKRLQAYMESQNILDFYLYTDTTCNYGFYEHHGMKRICEKKCNIKAYNNKEMSFFMYGTESVQ